MQCVTVNSPLLHKSWQLRTTSNRPMLSSNLPVLDYTENITSMV